MAVELTVLRHTVSRGKVSSRDTDDLLDARESVSNNARVLSCIFVYIYMCALCARPRDKTGARVCRVLRAHTNSKKLRESKYSLMPAQRRAVSPFKAASREARRNAPQPSGNFERKVFQG